jgi:hypothetical protein
MLDGSDRKQTVRNVAALFEISQELGVRETWDGADQTRDVSHLLISYQYTGSFELSASHEVILRSGRNCMLIKEIRLCHRS